MARPPIPSNVLYIGLALLLAVITSVLVGKLAGQNKPAETTVEAVQTVPVLVATQEIMPGQRLGPHDVKTIEWPVESAPSKEFTFERREEVLNRVVRESIFTSEPIFRFKLAGESSRGGLPVLIPAGKRAVTVSVSEIKGVAGFVKPGSFVDVLATMEIPGSGATGTENDHATRTVLQNVQVLAIAQKMTPGRLEESDLIDPELAETGTDTDKITEEAKDKKAKEKDLKKLVAEKSIDDLDGPAEIVKSVTLALTPEETEKIILADEIGNLRLVLRPELDEASTPTSGATQSQLLGRAAAPSPSTPTRSAPSGSRGGVPVEIYDGNERQVVRF